MVFIRFLFVVIFSMVWFGYGSNVPSKGEAFTKGLNDLSVEVEGFIFSATNSLDELATKDVNGVLVPTTQKEAIQKCANFIIKRLLLIRIYC